MKSDLGVYRLIYDLAKTPLITSFTRTRLVDDKMLNDPEYLLMTYISEGIYWIDIEDIIKGKEGYKYKYQSEAEVFLNRSEDMKELIEQQRINRRKIYGIRH